MVSAPRKSESADDRADKRDIKVVLSSFNFESLEFLHVRCLLDEHKKDRNFKSFYRNGLRVAIAIRKFFKEWEALFNFASLD